MIQLSYPAQLDQPRDGHCLWPVSGFGGAAGVKQMAVSMVIIAIMYPIIIGTEPASSGSECLGNQRHVAIVGCQCPVSRRWDVPPETISHEMMQKMGLVWFGHVWKMVSWCPMRYGNL